MTSDRWETLQALYLGALDLAPDRRERYVREKCGADEALCQEVLSLLGVEIHSVFSGLAVDVMASLPSVREGDEVDRYRLLERIGEGGMGVVYSAVRSDGAYDQTVALKLVKPGMDSESALRRFRRERQILADLQHPSIARLLDGGFHEGRPYIVVEYVHGEPITTYCDRRRLDVDARLRLFEQVCEAVAYAHHSLVVHRDLKPSNILVTDDEKGEPLVKLLDFGIARLLQGDGVASGPLTRTAERLLTPGYAAPEQIGGRQITTSTDVYGLGVVLYELLTGRKPIEVEGRDLFEMDRAVLEEAPRPPSTAVRTEDAALERDTTPARLARRLAGDLDTIILKALRKEPGRRYVSADELLMDLRRHRQRLPISARQDRALYRGRKFVQRHRAAVAAALVVLVLVAAVTTIAFERIRLERDRAQVEAEKAAEVANFLQDIFAVSDPSRSSGGTVTARELLDRGAQRITTELAEVPDVQAQMLHVVGEVYTSMGLYQQADSMLHRALELRHATLDDDHPDLARTLHALGILYETQGFYSRAAEVNGRAVDIFKDHVEEEEALANSLHSLAHAQMRLRALDEAERNIRQALEIKRDLLGDEHPAVAYSMNVLGDIYNYRGEPEAAEPILQDVLDMRRRLLGDEHLDVGVSLHNLGASLLDQERYAEAEPLYREALDVWLKVYGSKGNEYANTLSQLAMAVGAQARYAEAGELHRESLEILRRTFGSEHPRVASGLMRYARTLELEGRYSDAESAYREALDVARQRLGLAHPSIPMWQTHLARVVRIQERYREAEDLLEDARALCADNHGVDQACAEVVDAAFFRLQEAREEAGP